MDHYAIIVAGGTGNRMGADKPKQFLPLLQKPVLFHTLNAFFGSKNQPKILLALHPDFMDYWADLCRTYHFNIPHQVIAGGDTRYQSVKNCLKFIPDDALVAVHDAARPLVSASLIDLCYAEAAQYGNAVAALKTTDTVRQKKGDKIEQLDRDSIYLMQTPQTFRSALLKDAYAKPYKSYMTDDASVYQENRGKINFVEGERTNIKVTWPDDLALAEILLQNKKSPVRNR